MILGMDPVVPKWIYGRQIQDLRHILHILVTFLELKDARERNVVIMNLVKGRVSQSYAVMCQKFESVYFPSRIPLFRSSLLEKGQNFENQCMFRGRASPSKF